MKTKIKKYDEGGPAKKVRKNIITGRTRVTTPYSIGTEKGTVAPNYSKGTKTEVYSKKGDLIKTKYKHRGTGEYDVRTSKGNIPKYPYNYIREEEKPGGEKKEKYNMTPSIFMPKDKLKNGGISKNKSISKIKKYDVGGVTDTEQICTGKPPRCRQKFKSKGKSKESKGSIWGTLGAIVGGIGAYGAYKRLKKEQKGGVTKAYKMGGVKKTMTRTKK